MKIKTGKSIKRLLTTIISLMTMLPILAFGQLNESVSKHPKVIEMEMLLSKEATNFVQSRVQGGPIYVSVQIEPLRRSQGGKTEQLPYFYSEDEVQDEWDAIDTPMVLLLSRIKKAIIKVEVPATISENEIADLREKLFEHLKLIPVRDQINIEKKVLYAKKESTESKDYSLYYFIGGIVLVGFIGLFISLRLTSHKPNGTKSDAPAAAASAPAPMMPMKSSGGSGHSIATSASFNSKVNGDINFKDSIRAADMLKEKLHGVVNASIFPTLSDMVVLDELAKKSLSSFGAFVFEMPRKHQQKVFFRSPNDLWFKGYVEAASVDLDCFMAVEKMLRARGAQSNEKWEELLIQVWRLGLEAPLFLKQIPPDDAFTIMAYLPKSFAVPCAKKSFPGGWAKVLEAREVAPFTDEAKIDDYYNRTLQLKPYFSFKSIDDYRKDLELVDYLKSASTKDEEEIYESLNPESPIFNIRPPFYQIFRGDEEIFKEFFAQYDLTDWALAMINQPRDMVQIIFKQLDEKKKYIFRTYLKQLDENGVDPKAQVELREDMAKKYKYLVEFRKLNKKEASVTDISSGQNSNDKNRRNDDAGNEDESKAA